MEVHSEMLLHPELLSNEQLMHIIKERQLRVPNLQTMPRHQLLLVFHGFCVPYGQRRYRDSGRGKLNKARHLIPEDKNKPKFNTVVENSWKVSRYSIDARVKPPPDLLTGHFKRIKLEPMMVEPVKHANVFKRKMSVDDQTQVSDKSPPKKQRKPITWPKSWMYENKDKTYLYVVTGS